MGVSIFKGKRTKNERNVQSTPPVDGGHFLFSRALNSSRARMISGLSRHVARVCHRGFLSRFLFVRGPPHPVLTPNYTARDFRSTFMTLHGERKAMPHRRCGRENTVIRNTALRVCVRHSAFRWQTLAGLVIGKKRTGERAKGILFLCAR